AANVEAMSRHRWCIWATTAGSGVAGRDDVTRGAQAVRRPQSTHSRSRGPTSRCCVPPQRAHRKPDRPIRRRYRPRPARPHRDPGGGQLGRGRPAAKALFMGAVAARARADLRARWAAWLAVALAIGIAGAVALTAAAGARRTDTAYDRFLAQGHAEDLYFSI